MSECFYHAGTATRSLESHGTDIHGRIDIQIAELDHIDPGFLNKAAQSLEFPGLIGKARENEKVKRNEFLGAFGDVDRPDNVVKTVSLRPEIPMIEFSPGTAQADPERIHTCLTKDFNLFGQAGIGIHIDRAA